MYVPRFRQISPFLMFGVKRRKMIFKHRQTTNIRAAMLSLALVVLKDQISVLGPVLGLESLVLALRVKSLVLAFALKVQSLPRTPPKNKAKHNTTESITYLLYTCFHKLHLLHPVSFIQCIAIT